MAGQVRSEVLAEVPEIRAALGLQLGVAIALAIPEEVRDCAKIETYAVVYWWRSSMQI
jgi:hypothetical protein